MDACLFGITGGIASGKTTVCKMLQQKGLPIISLEVLLSNTIRPGSIYHKKIIDLLGEDLLSVNGTIDLLKLSLRMCEAGWIAENVNDILEDGIDDSIKKIQLILANTKTSIAGIEGKEILGSRISAYMKKVVLVTCPDKIRIERLVERSSMSRVTAIKAVTNDSYLNAFRFADFSINNSAGIDELSNNVECMLEKLLNSLKLV